MENAKSEENQRKHTKKNYLKTKEYLSMKKFISTFLVIIMLFGIGCGTNLFAFAEDYTYEDSKTIKTIFDVPDNRYNGYNSTNLGGISVGTANNRLFCVKSNGYEQIGTLYYYNNIYDSRFKNGTKSPKKIVFTDGLLGHANAMAIDDSYVYVTMAQKNGTEKTAILRISRLAISALKDGDVVSKTRTTVKDDTSGNTIKIYTVLRPKTTSGANYTKSISFITRYKSNKNTGVTKFIIGYPNGKQKLGFTFATLSGDNFTVSTSKDDVFYVNNPYAKSANDTGVVIQDIFYDAYYGFFVSMWMYKDNSPRISVNTLNYVLRANIKNLSTANNRTLDPVDKVIINKPTDHNGTLTKFEIESIACVKRDESKTDLDKYVFIFSCNKEIIVNGNAVGRDSIEELVGLGRDMVKFN